MNRDLIPMSLGAHRRREARADRGLRKAGGDSSVTRSSTIR